MMLAQPCFTVNQCALWQIVTSSAHVFFRGLLADSLASHSRLLNCNSTHR
ncbi:unnamed protein product [Staurois parvus]|uniref:Uncharacterized protein n=1 Tax=Staurois parvus TaxID=386267 RepID=A0ABN9AW60_9NEOB|nr:unnamed protein product [Staurois parvus]